MNERKCPHCQKSLERYEDPEAVKIIARLERELNSANDTIFSYGQSEWVKIKALEKAEIELAQLQADKARLDWLSSKASARAGAVYFKLPELCCFSGDVRQAVDSAMGKPNE